MLWEMYQQSQLNRVTSRANAAQRSADRTALRHDEAIDSLEAKIDGLTLTCRALFEILESQNAITEDQLVDKMVEIDLRDGTKDGRITPARKICTGCGRGTAPNRTRCMYCGGACVEDK